MKTKITAEDFLTAYKAQGRYDLIESDMKPMAEVLQLALTSLYAEIGEQLSALVNLNLELVREVSRLSEPQVASARPVQRTSGGRGQCYCGSTIWDNEHCAVCGR